MATQYTAGITNGQVWTADIANQIGAAWETWTPTVTPFSGAFTTLGTVQGRYCRIQKLVIGFFDVAITTNGTAGGFVKVTFPVTSRTYSTSGSIGSGAEIALFTTALNVRWNDTGSFLLLTYNGNYPAASGCRLTGTIVYEAA